MDIKNLEIFKIKKSPNLKISTGRITRLYSVAERSN